MRGCGCMLLITVIISILSYNTIQAQKYSIESSWQQSSNELEYCNRSGLGGYRNNFDGCRGMFDNMKLQFRQWVFDFIHSSPVITSIIIGLTWPISLPFTFFAVRDINLLCWVPVIVGFGLMILLGSLQTESKDPVSGIIIIFFGK